VLVTDKIKEFVFDAIVSSDEVANVGFIHADIVRCCRPEFSSGSDNVIVEFVLSLISGTDMNGSLKVI
jgi:hypothetical protein